MPFKETCHSGKSSGRAELLLFWHGSGPSNNFINASIHCDMRHCTRCVTFIAEESDCCNVPYIYLKEPLNLVLSTNFTHDRALKLCASKATRSAIKSLLRTPLTALRSDTEFEAQHSNMQRVACCQRDVILLLVIAKPHNWQLIRGFG